MERNKNVRNRVGTAHMAVSPEGGEVLHAIVWGTPEKRNDGNYQFSIYKGFDGKWRVFNVVEGKEPDTAAEAKADARWWRVFGHLSSKSS